MAKTGCTKSQGEILWSCAASVLVLGLTEWWKMLVHALAARVVVVAQADLLGNVT